MDKITTFKQAVEQSYQLSAPLLLENALQQISSEKESIQTALNESGTIKVPIVGDFSSGKSSLLNTFIGDDNLLPVDLTPETAVAYEIYHDYNERVELYRDGIKIDEKKPSEIKQLATRPGDIAKVFIKSSKIKDLEVKGITLVDMPGIDSGIKEHNDAILNYINKGTVFVLCVDCAGGSLRNSTLAFIGELSKYNLKPAILITKTDKKPASQLQEIVEYITYQAEKAIGGQTFVGTVSSHSHDIAAFEKFTNSINTVELLDAKFSPRVTQFCNQQINALSAQATIYSSNIEDAQKQIEALEAEKQNAEKSINNANVGDTPEKSTQDVLDLVSSALLVHSSDIAQMVLDKEDASAINARILNYIRPVIILAFREEGEQYASAMNTVVDNVSTALQDNMIIDGNLFDSLVDEFRDDIVGGISIAADALIAMPNIFAQALGWVLQFLGDKVPDLIKWFLGKSNEDVLLDVTQKVEDSIIPKIVECLRPGILQQITAQQQRIRQNISSSVVSAIGNIQDSVIASKEMTDKAELEKQLNLVNNAIEQISKIKNNI
ncbi:MAG: hypothetical protein HDR93_04640 [Bacteroides sp.]|nr:hypothetical protein [Bacteroides sp.]